MRDERELLEMGERIRELRVQHGYKQQWIADKVGVTLRTYQFWQAGKSPPEQENLEKLAKLFGVSPKYILRGETPDPVTNGHATDLSARVDEIAKQVNELHALLLGDGDAELVAGLAARLLQAAELPHKPADAPPQTPPEARRRKRA